MLLAFAAFGYAVVGALFLVLIALLLSAWRGQRVGVILILACLASAIWAIVMAGQTQLAQVNPVLMHVVDLLRLLLWVLFLVYLSNQIGVARWLLGLCVGIGVAGLFAAPVAWLTVPELAGERVSTYLLAASGLSVSFCGLLLTEQVYRNTPITTRWGIKPLAIGLGGLFAYDLYYYSQVILFSSIDSIAWVARGWVNVIFVPAIAVAARRSPDWELRIFVSRQAVFFSTTLLAVGVYFIFMSIGGYLLQQFGGSWGALARVVFIAGAAVVLATLLSSGMLRARLRVFLNKHFFENKYDYREEWLRLVVTLAEFSGGQNLGVAIRAIGQIVDSPSGALWVLDERGGKFRQEADWDCPGPLPDLESSDPLIKFAADTGWIVDIDEYQRDRDTYPGLVLDAWLEERRQAWLVIPLFAERDLIGLVMLDRAPSAGKLNYEDRDLLKTAGNHIAVHLSQSRSEELLSEARQFEAYNRLTAFLMHDLNNLIAQLSLIVQNAEKHKRNPDFVDDSVATIAGSVERMKSVMEQLRQGRSDRSRKRTELRFLVSRAVERCVQRKPRPELVTESQEIRVELEADEFVSVLTNIVKNAQEATGGEGSVRVTLEKDGQLGVVNVEDDGPGMTEEFVRKRLFKPFDSTKGSQGMGIGVYHAREYARRIGGDLEVDSVVGRGTRMSLRVPLAPAAE